VGTWALLTSALRRSRARAFGPANRITLARATLVGGVTALVADRLGDGVPVMALVTLAALALALDAVDGQVARRTATVSTLGARFDMEVDAFLILILSIAVTPSIGAWVLMIGAMRYVFAVAACVTPWLRAPLPPSRAKKAVAALQGIVLIVASAGVVPRPSALAAVGLALALLMWSFGRDTLCLWHNRRHRTRGGVGAGRRDRRDVHGAAQHGGNAGCGSQGPRSHRAAGPSNGSHGLGQGPHSPRPVCSARAHARRAAEYRDELVALAHRLYGLAMYGESTRVSESREGG
jgi:phosphatidylglycerophosphate synthase